MRPEHGRFGRVCVCVFVCVCVCVCVCVTQVNSRVTSVAASTICPSPAMSWRQSCSNSRLITSPAYNVLHSAAARLEALSPVAAAAQLFRGLRVGQILGQGNFGTVWTAHWHSMNVALKVRCVRACVCV